MSVTPQQSVQQRLQQGLQFQERGDFAQAIEVYTEILSTTPHPQALHLRGLAEHLRGNSAAGLPFLEQAVRQSPQSAPVRNSLGAIYLACGRWQEAEDEFRLCGQLQPNFQEAWSNLGQLLLQQNRPGEAALIWQHLTEIAPDFGLAWHHLGVARERCGQLQRAEQAYRAAITRQQNPFRTHNDLAHLLLQQGKTDQAVTEFERAVTLQPTFARGWSNLGAALHQRQDWERAEAALQRAIEIRPDFAGALFNYGNLLKERNRTAEAVEKYQAAVALRPDNQPFRLNLAVALTVLGKATESVAEYRHIIARQPDCLQAYYSLLTFHGEYVTRQEVEQLERLLQQGQLTATQRSEASFGLGKYYDQRGENDRAFSHYQTGNRIVATQRPFAAARFGELIDQICHTFTPELFARFRDQGTASRQPIFIVGMPRSGSTLVEQILSSHSQVRGAGEFYGIRRLIKQVLPQFNKADYPGVVRELAGSALPQLAADYLSQLELMAGAALRITDKMPSNLFHLGFISLLFPQATLIYTQRNRLDVCLSCYFQNFVTAHEYSFDLRQLAHFYQAHERMLAHWQRVCPAPIHIVDYERLVQDQEAQTHRLIEQICGLPWETGCLEFHRNRRAVHTASLSQVRQPMYDSSIGKWKKYARHLGPLFEELGIRELDAA